MKLRRLVDFAHRSERPSRVTSIGPLDIMKSRRQISERSHLAASFFASGWEAKNGGSTIGAMSLEYHSPSGRPIAPQEIDARRQRVADRYEEACRRMDEHDFEDGFRPITRYVLHAVACELMSLEQIDRTVGRRKGWAARVLVAGIGICETLYREQIEAELAEHDSAA